MEYDNSHPVLGSVFASTANGHSVGFATVFNENGNPNEAQAAGGDSGGGVFSGDGTLLGIMTNMFLFPSQPGETAVFGNATYAIDLSFYREQIFEIAPGLRPTVVAEPVTLAILLAGAAAMTLRKRRRV